MIYGPNLLVQLSSQAQNRIARWNMRANVNPADQNNDWVILFRQGW